MGRVLGVCGALDARQLRTLPGYSDQHIGPGSPHSGEDYCRLQAPAAVANSVPLGLGDGAGRRCTEMIADDATCSWLAFRLLCRTNRWSPPRPSASPLAFRAIPRHCTLAEPVDPGGPDLYPLTNTASDLVAWTCHFIPSALHCWILNCSQHQLEPKGAGGIKYYTGASSRR